MLVTDPTLATAFSIGIVLVGIILLLLIISWVGRFLIRLVVALVANVVLGFVALLLISYLFGIMIPLTKTVILCVILFGLPGVGTLVVLKAVGLVVLMAQPALALL